MASTPTVVLVHGAFADASSWNGVVTRLQKQGYTVVPPALAMRGLSTDSAYLACLLGQIPGPVVLVGHSYGGAVISNVRGCPRGRRCRRGPWSAPVTRPQVPT